VAEVEEERSGAALPDDLDGFVGEPVGQVLARRTIFQGWVAVGAEVAAGRTPFAAGDVEVKSMFVRPGGASAEMPLADMPGRVAALFQRGGERELTHRQRMEIGHIAKFADAVTADVLGDADAGGIFAGQDAGARRRADRTRCIAVGEAHPLRGETFEVRRFVERTPVTLEVAHPRSSIRMKTILGWATRWRMALVIAFPSPRRQHRYFKARMMLEEDMKIKWLGVLSLAVGLALAGCGGQPSAGGKKLRDWLEVIKKSNDAGELKQAADALTQMGPAAEPASYELVRLLSDRQWFGHYRSLNPTQVEDVFTSFTQTIRAIGPAVVPVILQSLEYERPISRDVILALSSTAVPELAKGLVHQEPKVRSAVAQLLAERGREATGTAPLLIKALADGDATVRRAAAKTLGFVATDKSEAATALLPLLDDKTIWVRVAAIEGLQALASTAEPVVSALTGKLNDGDPVVRGAAASGLASFGKAAGPAVPVLVGLLDDKVKDVQRKAITALGQITPLQPVAARALVTRLESEDIEIGPAAINALAGMGAEAAPAIPFLLEQMKRRGFRQSPAFAKVLSSIGAPAVPASIELLRYRVTATEAVFETNPDEGWTARATAADALAAMGTAAKEAAPVLKEVAETDRNAFVVKAAKAALKQIEAR